MKIEWASGALNDLDRLHSFLSDLNILAAVGAIDAILADVAMLAEHPAIGKRAIANENIRIWPVKFGENGYIIRYSVEPSALVILRIYHSREDRP